MSAAVTPEFSAIASLSTKEGTEGRLGSDCALVVDEKSEAHAEQLSYQIRASEAGTPA